MRSKARRVAGEFADSSPERNKWRRPERCPGTPESPGRRTKISTCLNERDTANGTRRCFIPAIDIVSDVELPSWLVEKALSRCISRANSIGDVVDVSLAFAFCRYLEVERVYRTRERERGCYNFLFCRALAFVWEYGLSVKSISPRKYRVLGELSKQNCRVSLMRRKKWEMPAFHRRHRDNRDCVLSREMILENTRAKVFVSIFFAAHLFRTSKRTWFSAIWNIRLLAQMALPFYESTSIHGEVSFVHSRGLRW